MYTQISAEMITQQKLKEYRQQAETNRMLNLASENRPEGNSKLAKFFSWIFKKPMKRQDDRQARSDGSRKVFSHSS